MKGGRNLRPPHIQFFTNHFELYVVTFNKNYHAQLFQQKTGNQSLAQSIREISQIENSLVSVNGGFYTSNFRPAGLFTKNSKILAKPAQDPLLASCMRIDIRGKIFLEKSASNCIHAAFAMQTGPILIENGVISSTLNILQNTLIN